MANVDDPDFDSFVDGVLNATFSSAFDPEDVSNDNNRDDVIIHNFSNNDSYSDNNENIEQTNNIFVPPVLHSNGEQYNINYWVNVTENDQGPNKTMPIYNPNKGPNLPISFDNDKKPIDYFLLFFNDEILQCICKETNDFANNRKAKITSPRSRLRKWNNISASDLKTFLGVVLNMGLMPLPNIENYFSTKWTQRINFFCDVFYIT